jgi:Lon protease-like protein
VIAPGENRRDLDEVPRNVRREIEFIWVDNMDQVLDAVFPSEVLTAASPVLTVAAEPEVESPLPPEEAPALEPASQPETPAPSV